MKAIIRAIHPVLMVRDVAVSIEFFKKLGFQLAFQDSPTGPKYAGMRRDHVELHMQWHDANEWSYPNDRPTYRFYVEDVDALFAEFEKELPPGTSQRGVWDTGWGTREFHIRDPDRNGLQFYRDL